jgi:hypothetical protein
LGKEEKSFLASETQTERKIAVEAPKSPSVIEAFKFLENSLEEEKGFLKIFSKSDVIFSRYMILFVYLFKVCGFFCRILKFLSRFTVSGRSILQVCTKFEGNSGGKLYEKLRSRCFV